MWITVCLFSVCVCIRACVYVCVCMYVYLCACGGVYTVYQVLQSHLPRQSEEFVYKQQFIQLSRSHFVK